MGTYGRREIVGGAVALGLVGAITVAAVAVPGMTASGTPDSASFGAVGTTETVPCPGGLAEGAAFKAAGNEVEGETYSCGVVVAPEDHSAPNGTTFELFYLKLHAKTSSPASTPLVYLAGGPGSSGSYELTSNPLLNQNLDRVRETRDVIAYDQRGTGYSNYLLCAPFESALGILQDRDRNPQIARTIKDLQDTTLGIGYGALRSNLCGVGTTLLAGVDLAKYNSVQSAADIPLMVRALGYTDGYSLYGTSYGTRLAQYAMRGDPQGVRAVVLDGVGGPSIPNSMWSSTKDVAPYESILEQCAADTACSGAYPDLAKRFAAVLAKLEKQPLVLDPPLVVIPALGGFGFPPVLTRIDPEFFRSIARVNNIALGGGFAAAVPRMIVAAEKGDTAWFRTSPLAAKEQVQETPQPTVQTGGGAATLPFESDQPLFGVPFLTLISVAQNAVTAQDPTIDTQWLTIAVGDLAVRLVKGEDQADLMEKLLRLSVVPNQGTSAQELIDFANGNLSPEAAAGANAIAERMTRDDVRATLWGIQDIAMALGNERDVRSYSAGMQNAVNCSDELAFTPIDVAEADVAKTSFPQLVAFPVEVNQQTLLTCLSYPSELDRSVMDPVASDIPALVYVSSLDNETPVGWGALASEGFTARTLVEWRNIGHVAAAHDPKYCAGDIAAAFLADPSSPPDTSCSEADDYRIAFVLP
jgi:pimeloyl-ACP methyl ester carboxylesterase